MGRLSLSSSTINRRAHMTEAIKESPDQTSIPKRSKKNQSELLAEQEATLRKKYRDGTLDKTKFDEAMSRIREQREIVITPDTKFFKGKFQSKSNPLETEQVIICVNGENFMFKRNILCIAPEPVLLAAKDAVYPKYTQSPGVGRKIVSIINRFVFNIEGDATFDEFKAMYAAGTKLTREKVAQHGLNIPIAESVPQT
jgi:hypothetical protein